MAARSQFREFRKDGWPYCPCCGEEELYSHACMAWNDLETPKPTMEEVWAQGFKCYACGWDSETKPAPVRARRWPAALAGE